MSITVHRDKMPKGFRRVPFALHLSGRIAIEAAMDACGNGSGIEGLAFVREDKDPFAFLTAEPGRDFATNIRAIHAVLKENGVPYKFVVQTTPAARLNSNPKDPDKSYVQGFAANKGPFAGAKWTQLSCYWRPLGTGFSLRVQEMELTNKGVSPVVDTARDFASLEAFKKAVEAGSQPRELLGRVPFALQDAVWWLRRHTFIRYQKEDGKKKGVLIHAAYPVVGKPGVSQAVSLYALWRRDAVPNFAVRDVTVTANGLSISKSPIQLGVATRAKKTLEVAKAADLVDNLMTTWDKIMAWAHGDQDARAEAMMGRRGK